MGTPASPFPKVFMRFSSLIPRGTKIWFLQNSSSSSAVCPYEDPKEQNQAYFMLKLSIFVYTKYNLNEKSYSCNFYNRKIFQNPLHSNAFSKCINSLKSTFDYYSFFAFNINKIMKIITPQNPGDPRGIKFHSPKPRGTKKYIPHIPHSPRNEIW